MTAPKPIYIRRRTRVENGFKFLTLEWPGNFESTFFIQGNSPDNSLDNLFRHLRQIGYSDIRLGPALDYIDPSQEAPAWAHREAETISLEDLEAAGELFDRIVAEWKAKQ
jgi:hypothetical protein